MRLNLITVPNKLLQQKSKKVNFVDDKLRNFINDMIETMYEDQGMGLAAVQVGSLLRIVVIDIQEDKKNKKNPMVFINPKIICYSEDKEIMEEGCLSVPGVSSKVVRSLSVEVGYNDLEMNEKTIKADGVLAHCLQHEIDHTNGILYIDYLSKLKRDFLIKKCQKAQK